MSVPEAYVTVPTSLSKFLDAIRSAGIPPRVTFEFLKTVGLTSSNDRAIIGVMKAIGFLDGNGVPTETYKAYRNRDDGPKVLGKALRSSYADLFMANMKANELTREKLQGIIATKISKGERVVKEIAQTFKTLAKHADFSEPSPDRQEQDTSSQATESSSTADTPVLPPIHTKPQFHYNIQIHLPTTTDLTVYNAIFKSLREHLL